MIKLLVFVLLLIFSGSKQDSLSDLDTEEVKNPERSSNPCSSQFSESVSKDQQVPNEEKNGQHLSNEDNKDDKIPIALNCLIQTHEENAIKFVTETTEAPNLSNQKSQDIKYLIATKDSFRDFTTNRNRSKIIGEPTLYIDVAEKCNKVETKSQENKLGSGRRFNNISYIDNIQDIKQSSIDANSSSTSIDLNLVPKMDLNSTNHRSKMNMEVDKELITNKVSYGTTVPPKDHDRILGNKVTDNYSPSKYVSSTTPYDKEIPQDMFFFLDLGNKVVTDKTSTKKSNLLSPLNTSAISNKSDKNDYKKVIDKSSTNKYDSIFTTSDGRKKDSSSEGGFMLLDFSKKEISDKPSILKYNLISLFENETTEVPLSEHKLNFEPDLINSKKPYVPANDIDKKKLLHNDFSSKDSRDKHSSELYIPESVKTNLKITSDRNFTYEKSNNNDLIKKYEPTSTTFDINKDFIYNNISKILTHAYNFKVFTDQSKEVTQKDDGDKYSTYKYDLNSTSDSEILKDLFSQHALSNKAHSDKNIKLSMDNQDPDKKNTNKYEQLYRSYNDIYKDLLLHQDLGDKKNDDKNILRIKLNHQDLMLKGDGNLLSTSKYEQTSTPYDNITKDLLLYLDLNNRAHNNKNDKIDNENHHGLANSVERSTNKYTQTFTPEDITNLLVYHDLNNNATNDKNINLPIEDPLNVTYREDSDKPSTYKYKDTSASSGNIYEDLILYHNVSSSIANHKNINITKEHQDITYKNNDDKDITNTSNTFTPNDDLLEDLLLFLSLRNKSLSDKNITVFGDHKDVKDKVSSDKKYDGKSLIQISKEHTNDLNYKELYNKPSIEKEGSSALLKGDLNKNVLFFHDLGDKRVNEKNSSEIHDLKSVLKKNEKYDEHDQVLTYRKNANHLSDNKYDHNIKANLYPYQGETGHKKVDDKHTHKKYDLQFTVHNETSKENFLELDHKDISSMYAMKGSHSYEKSKDELKTTVDVREPHLVEPTTGYSIKDLFKARVMLLESTRVCYACSSISDHSCWQPSRSTTVKYCRKGHNACLTKTFKTEESEFIVIRDCGTTCDGTWPVLDARYKSCSICHEDMCNDHLIDINSGHINTINFLYLVSITAIIIFIV